MPETKNRPKIPMEGKKKTPAKTAKLMIMDNLLR